MHHDLSQGIRSALGMLSAAYARERTLFGLGILGIVLGTACLAVAAVRGPLVPPEGELLKAANFDIAVGIYILTVALFVPLAEFSEKGRRRWIGATAAFAVYSYGLETVQNLRGLDPRFTRAGTPLDQILGAVFGLVALVITASFLVLAWRVWRRPLAGRQAEVLLAARYACAAALFAFAAGVWMSVNQGEYVGGGSVMPLHAAGFHGLQAVPLVALLYAWSGAPDPVIRRAVHLAGSAWICACAAIAWQTVLGRPVLEPGPASLLAAAAFTGWAVVALQAMLAWRGARGVVRAG